MTPIWRGEVEMRWEGRHLMLECVCIGTIDKYHGVHWAVNLATTPFDQHIMEIKATEAEARSALVTAAVRALGGGGNSREGEL